MIDGLRFNSVHSNTLNLVLTDSSRPLFQETKDTYIDVPHKDGSVLIPDKSKKDTIVTVEFFLKTPDNSTIYNEARNISNWLQTEDRAPLIFDDDPNYTYAAKVNSSITLEEITDFEHYGEFTVQFRCLPYAIN